MSKKMTVSMITAAAVCLALCMLLPFLTGQIPQIGQALSPMHIPVLLAGFVCGPFYALAVGLIAPVLRFALFGMPPIMPTGVAMCFELAAYGFVAGILYRRLPKSVKSVYVSLVTAMVAGRVVWGVVRVLLSGVAGAPFTWAMFLSGAVTSAIPGIIVHIALIPPIVIGLKKALPIMNR